MQASGRAMKIFAGRANLELAEKICGYLGTAPSKAEVTRFSDGELHVEIGENVRGCDTFIVQPTSAPANEHLMELLIMCDALKRASADSIVAVMPYYGYGRQDRKVAPRTPITAKLVANLLSTAGVTRVVSMDMHAGQIQGFFDIPFDHLYAMPVFLDHLRSSFVDPSEFVMVSPDAGGVERVRAYSKRLGCQMAIVDKRRPRPNVAEIMNLIGEVQGKDAVLLDDMVDTGGTLTQAADALLKKGARRVFAYAVHGVLSGPAIKRVNESGLESLVITDTIALSDEARGSGKIRQLTVAPLFGEAIRRIHFGDSLSSLFV